MSFFEFLTGGKSNGKKTSEVQRLNAEGDSLAAVNGNIENFSPRSFDDVATIIDHLLSGKPAIVHLSEVKDSTARRVIDLLSGAIYVMNGNLCELKKEVYIFTPNGIKIN